MSGIGDAGREAAAKSLQTCGSKLIVLFKTRTVGKPDTALIVGKSDTTLIFFYNIILDEQAAHCGRREQEARNCRLRTF